MNIYLKIFLIPVAIIHCHGGHSGHISHNGHIAHSVHSTNNRHSIHKLRKPYNHHYIATSAIASYLIFDHFNNNVEELFYYNENYNIYNITYYVKIVDDNIKECIYYVVTENLNNESVIDASNVKIIENITTIEYNNLYGIPFCRTFKNTSISMVTVITTIQILIILCCSINCLYSSINYTNRNLY